MKGIVGMEKNSWTFPIFTLHKQTQSREFFQNFIFRNFKNKRFNLGVIKNTK